jgi:tetratricopeptide (TPR) repeat protein
LNDYEGAEADFKKAYELGYKNDTSIVNMGLLYASMQRFDDSEKCFEEACALNPENYQAAWQWSLTMLDRGHWKDGLRAYDVRRLAKKEYAKLPYELWDGQNLNGKTIFIQSEQGLGDRILFTRYLHWLKKEYPECHIKFLCDPKLSNLLWHLKEETDYEIIPDKVPWPKADYGQFLMNLPRFHGTTPDNVYPDPGLIAKRAAAVKANVPQSTYGNPLKVGVCWTGNPVMDQNTQRSVPFQQILSLADDPNIQLYSFQYGSLEIQGAHATELMHDMTPWIDKEGFIGTASCLNEMDVVVTSCTSVAHLAGALGKKTYVMLCYAPYWVWLRERNDSVWYPSVKLVRQTVPGEWCEVINTIKTELQTLAKEKQ